MMTKEQRIEWTQQWRKLWNSTRALAYIGDNEEDWLAATRDLITAAHKIMQLPIPDKQALNEVQLRIRYDCDSDREELPKA